jgi:hypothetical protein
VSAGLQKPGRLAELIAQRTPSREGAAVVGHDLEPALVEVEPVSRQRFPDRVIALDLPRPPNILL